MKYFLWILMVYILPHTSLAHEQSTGFLHVKIEGNYVRGELDLALRDLILVSDLDENRDYKITWNELKSRHSELAAFFHTNLKLLANGNNCSMHIDDQQLTVKNESSYHAYLFTASCPNQIDTIAISYDGILSIDQQHRLLINIEPNSDTIVSAVISDQEHDVAIALKAPKLAETAIRFLREGVLHIWLGFDHVLFLIILLLPVVLRRSKEGWQGAESIKPVFIDTIKIVTCFTLAHSITLSLATLGIVHFSPQFVEPIIAASIIIAALNNLIPFLHLNRSLLAFAFGLIHGFGFALVLGELGLSGSKIMPPLIAFNIGVELGQIAIVLLLLPPIYALRRHRAYMKAILYPGSVFATILAGIWLIERIWQVEILGI